ncbi:TonB-linked outer membrane protein, SusC/RagA family [Mucilaginibacter gossypiicola]|uniref:TonB-linked outer membrane protein, SusC/RagA family n=1 Tax=Mucilaginibacter gossypiicola TaxID=551995 RepID=A0A1H8TV82_9SPHI|nr:SusC/RagA family TonB-linked outer membrane protein [Mucilaginibacter gossypiicola]SEO94912.1 TonB-linked outer membrane protein, SusC/RagA family [Mucilaginibacter gossypiicola]
MQNSTFQFWRRLCLLVFALAMLSVSGVYAQQTVTGTVTSKEDGTTLPGISVSIKGTSQGTATDAAGKFSIKAAGGTILLFRGLGYDAKEVTVSGSTLNVTLDTKQNGLNEVVVIGYGTTTRQNITTAVTKVDPKKIPQAANNSIPQLLFGRASGLQVSQGSSQPGGNINLSIRGRGNPLYVVDGVIFPGDGLEPGNGTIAGETNGVSRGGLAGLNPDDVESIEVLKDASAAIYGVNAANGVILITTKKGKAGRLNITYSGSYSFEKNYPYLQPLKANQYETLYNQLITDQYLAGKQQQPYGPNPQSGLPTPKYSAADIAAAGNGTDWLGQIFRTGAINNHQVNINGGSEKATYYFSGGYYNEDGTLKGAGLNKYTGRANLSFTPAKFLTLNANFTGNTNSYLNSSSGGQTGGSGTQGFGIIQAALGYPANVAVRDASGNYTRYGVIANPVSLLDVQDNTSYHSLNANLSADLKVIPGVLAGHLLFGDNYEAANRTFFVPSTVFYFSQNLSRASMNYNNRENQTLEATVTFKKDIAKFLNIDAVAGAGQYKNTYNAFGSQGAGGADVIGATNLSAETANIGITSVKTASKTRSYFARSSFSFLDKYLLTLSYRYDGYSLFFPNTKYASFPSASVGWKISNEDFMKNVSFVSLLKLRASAGTTGSTIGAAGYGGYAPDGNTIFFTNGAVNYATIARYAIDHPELTWQKTENKNIGLDFGLFKDRVTGSVDVFRDDITNLLRTTGPTAPLSYLSTQPVNGGHQYRQGYDISLSTQNLKLHDFTWNSAINVSHYTYRWKSRFVYDNLLAYQGVTYQAVNDPVNEIYYFKTKGLLQPGQTVPASQPTAGGANLPGSPIYVDADGDGKLTGADIAKLNPDPKISIGFGNDFHYKQFDLSIFFYGQFGGKGINYNNAWGDPNSIVSSTQSGTVQALNAWTSVNQSGTRPGVNYIESATGLPQGSDINLVSTNFVRCRNLTLGYTFNSPWLNKFTKSVRVFADAQNLFIITKYKGVDPEVSYASVKGGYAPYPMFRTFSFGLRAGF